MEYIRGNVTIDFDKDDGCALARLFGLGEFLHSYFPNHTVYISAHCNKQEKIYVYEVDFIQGIFSKYNGIQGFSGLSFIKSQKGSFEFIQTCEEFMETYGISHYEPIHNDIKMSLLSILGLKPVQLAV